MPLTEYAIDSEVSLVIAAYPSLTGKMREVRLPDAGQPAVLYRLVSIDPCC